ncbi:MAG: hypothetical protein JNJ54_11075 [Myxococcaceae bacterium]|nr:hypothetical protein [Myxococcaceae bacterium]
MNAFRWVLSSSAALLASCGPGFGKPCGLTDEPEPNETRDQATMLALGAERAACSASETDEDWFQLAPGTAVGFFKVTLSAVGAGTVDATVYAASDNGVVGTSEGTAAGQNVTVLFSSKANQTFRVRVKGSPENAELPGFKYTITAAFTAAQDPFEPNDSRDAATQLTLNTPVNASFLAGFAGGAPLPDSAGDDWYKVTLVAGQRLNVALENVATNVTPSVVIFAPDQSEYANESRPSAGQSVLWTSMDRLTAAGVYHLKISPQSLEEVGASQPDHFTRLYKLTVRQVP